MRAPRPLRRGGALGRFNSGDNRTAVIRQIGPSPQASLDAPTLIACRFMWWRMRRIYGVPLAAESGVILTQGGRP